MITLQELNENNYIVLNGKIENVILAKNEDKLIFRLLISGDNWGCNYGDFDIADKWFAGPKSIMDLMDVLGVVEFSEIKGQYLRVAVQNMEEPVRIIGNIISDQWFNFDDYRITRTDVPEEAVEPVEETEEIIEDEVIDLDD